MGVKPIEEVDQTTTPASDRGASGAQRFSVQPAAQSPRELYRKGRRGCEPEGDAPDQMTTAENPRVMEALWADLTRQADAFESPDWHAAVLRESDPRIAEGREPSTDWRHIIR